MVENRSSESVMADDHKIVPYCKLVLGRPKLCFGKTSI